jgi:hypothetical protein
MELHQVPVGRAGIVRCGHSVRRLWCAFLWIYVTSASSQEQLPEAPASLTDSEQTIADRLHTLAAGTEIHLRLLEPVASHTHKRGDRFKLEVAEPITVDQAVIVPAGSPATGEVVHAAKSGMSGKAGELILVARFLRVGEHEVKLRSFVAGNGENRLALATGLGMTLGLPALFVVGKNLVLPADTDVYAKVSADTSLPSVVGVGAGEVSQPAITESSTEITINESE